jgi:hypothetical protein
MFCMSHFKTMILRIILSTSLASCNSQAGEADQQLSPLNGIATAATAISTVTFTKVKKP